MFTAAGVEQGSIITEGLNAWYDFGDIACFNPTLYTGSIAANTPFKNLAPGQSPATGSITGSVNWSTAFGGCLNLTSNTTSTLQYNAGFSASFTVQTIVTPGTDANPEANWTSDAGGWPTLRATNGFIWAQAYAASPGNNLIPILYAGAGSSTLPSGTRMPSDGWNSYMRFPNVYTFSTNGSNLHNTYMNNVNKATDTTTRTRGNSSVGTIYLNFDNAVSNRHGTGRIVAYLHYNRQLSDAEVYQNVQYYLNRFGTK
jgi:hypothetical protein